MKSARTTHLALLSIVTLVACWSGWRPYDRLTWWLEIAPGLVGIIILLATYPRFKFTSKKDMLFALIGAVCALLFLSHFHDRALRKIASGTC